MISSRSRPARGAWVEILVGEFFTSMITSRPARGAWVEILEYDSEQVISKSRPARGAWVEIIIVGKFCSVEVDCRAPQGARGLKS